MPLKLGQPAAKQAAVAPHKPSVDKYARLLEKVQSLNLGGGGFWKPPEGRSTFRILPAVGTMGYFFKEVGTHYLPGEKHFACLSISTDGQQDCPLCQVEKLLRDSGDKEAASAFYPSRSFTMNIIDRSKPDDGVKLYSPGVTVFQGLASMVADPDYGDISDVDNGFDVKLDRKGEGQKTKYQVSAARNPSPLGTADQVQTWLEQAQDIEAMVAKQLLSPEELIKQAGIGAYFGMEEAAAEEEPEEEEVEEVEELDEEDVFETPKPAARPATSRPVPQPAAGKVSTVLNQRMNQRAALLKKAH